MKRHPALQDLSRDHHHALVRAKALRDAAADLTDPQALRDVARDFLAFWDAELAEHFAEEEAILLPVLRARDDVDVATDEQVQRMLTDHAWFRQSVDRLSRRVVGAKGVDPLLDELGRRLDEHARFEDRELFPRLEDQLTDDELAAIAEASAGYRTEHRGPASVGPRTTRDA